MTSRRVVVWGVGRHALGKVLPAIAAASGLELYGVCSRDAQRVAECSDRWRCKGWTDPASMLRDDAIDVVYVATPIALHGENGRRVLEAGKHLWCDKPLATSRDAVNQLIERSARLGLSVCEGHMYLHHPHFRQLRRYITEGHLGRVTSIECRFGIPRLEHPGFRSDPSLGGGALFDVGCYPISAVHALFPEAPASVAYASIHSQDAWPLDTEGHAVLELSNGAVAHLEWRINASYRNEIDVWGDRGSVFTEKIFSKPADFVPSFRLRDLRGGETIEPGHAADHFVLMLQDFSKMIDDKDALESAQRRIVRTADVMDQIRSVGQPRRGQEV
jgi:dTDP-3,4-didehydro-2,6-dideoxy-alpha-D-glucose 3-reductase